MKKAISILYLILVLLILLGIVFYFIDINRTLNNKKPVFCYDASGGSGIVYIGLGYVIRGAYDDIPGGLANAKGHTWIWWLLEDF